MVSTKAIDKAITSALEKNNGSPVTILSFKNLTAGSLVVYQVNYSDTPPAERVAFWSSDRLLSEPPNWDYLAQ